VDTSEARCRDVFEGGVGDFGTRWRLEPSSLFEHFPIVGACCPKYEGQYHPNDFLEDVHNIFIGAFGEKLKRGDMESTTTPRRGGLILTLKGY
jgi:hypothetical protein